MPTDKYASLIMSTWLKPFEASHETFILCISNLWRVKLFGINIIKIGWFKVEDVDRSFVTYMLDQAGKYASTVTLLSAWKQRFMSMHSSWNRYPSQVPLCALWETTFYVVHSVCIVRDRSKRDLSLLQAGLTWSQLKEVDWGKNSDACVCPCVACVLSTFKFSH